jgi:hypothetical protein
MDLVRLPGRLIEEAVEGRITAIQFRRTWYGKYVLQIQRVRLEHEYVSRKVANAPIFSHLVETGVFPFRDLKRSEEDEFRAFLNSKQGELL